MKTDALTRMALEAVLLFHSGSPWNEAKSLRWQIICSSILDHPAPSDLGNGTHFAATTRVLCDLTRAALTGSEGIQ